MAPSSKNRQPWKFIVATGNEKDEACRVMEDGISRERSAPFIPESREQTGSSPDFCGESIGFRLR